MTSTLLKEAALYWLRFEKGMTHICTEYGEWRADVAGACKTRLIEIETKISLTDLRADFRKFKHRYYREGQRTQMDVPNYFFFMVPVQLAEAAVKLCEEKAPLYGVISFDPLEEIWSYRIKVVKKSRRIHGNPPVESIFEHMAGRMSAEIVAAHSIKNQIDSVREHVASQLRERLEGPIKTVLDIYEDYMEPERVQQLLAQGPS